MVFTGSSRRSVSDELLRERLECPHHRRALREESSISPQMIIDRGHYTAKSKAELGRLLFAFPADRAGDGDPNVLPIEELTTHQTKPDAPRQVDGKAVKYETPAKSPLRLDVHPGQSKRVKDASVPLWVVEGVKKGDCLVSRGLCAVALQGVWCWQKGGVLLTEWEGIRLWGRIRIRLRRTKGPGLNSFGPRVATEAHVYPPPLHLAIGVCRRRVSQKVGTPH